MFLYPKTVYSKNAKGSDIAIQIQDIYTTPEYVYLTSCVDGYATLSRTARVLSSSANWEQLRVLGEANMTGVEFMHRWAQNPEGRYKPYTYGEPVCFWTDKFYGTTGKLYWQKNQYVPAELLIDSEVSAFAVCHGWKSVVDPTTDQGLILVYATAGQVFMRSYQEVTLNFWSWSDPVLLYSGNIKDLSISRSLDYRVLITLVTLANKILLIPSDRTYPGTGITLPDTSTVTMDRATISRTLVNYHDQIQPNETSNVSFYGYTKRTLVGASNQIINAYNNGGTTLFVSLLSDVDSYDLSKWIVKDSINRQFVVLDALKQEGLPVGSSFVLTLVDFNNAVGNMTLTILSGGTTIEGNTVTGDMTYTFVPEGLEPIEIPPVELIAISNIWVGDDK